MAERIAVPRIGWTGRAVLRRWLKEDGAWVTSGSAICLVRVEDRLQAILCHSDGFLHLKRPIARPGAILARHVELGTVVGPQEAADASGWQLPLPPRVPRRINRRLGLKLAQVVPLTRPRSTPRARHLARTHELDLATVEGTGRDGRIRGCDVERLLAERGKSDDATVISTPAPVATAPPAVAPAEPIGELSAPEPAPSVALDVRTQAVERPKPIRGHPVLFLQATWNGAPADSPPSGRAGIDLRELLAPLLRSLAIQLRRHPGLLARPLPPEEPLRIQVVDADPRQTVASKMLIWESPGASEALECGSEPDRSNETPRIHFQCYLLGGRLDAGAAPLSPTQHAVLAIGSLQSRQQAAASQHSAVWQRSLTLSFDPSVVDWWQATRFFHAVTEAAEAPAGNESDGAGEQGELLGSE